MRIWIRDPSSSKKVESVLSENDGIKLDICSEHQGEAVAVNPDMTGYYTTTELSKKNSSHQFAPIYYYSFSDATMKTLNLTAQAQVRDKKYWILFQIDYIYINSRFIVSIYTHIGLRLSNNRWFTRMFAYISNCRGCFHFTPEAKYQPWSGTRNWGWECNLAQRCWNTPKSNSNS